MGACRRICVALALGTVPLALAACGSGSDGGNSTSVQTTVPGVPPPGAPQAQVIASKFPKPKPVEGAPAGAKKAIEAGRQACRGKTPTQVVHEFLPAANENGGVGEMRSMLAEMPKYEKQARTTPDFVAGQLAARVYEATLPEELALAGYQGCIYELSVQLRHELSQQGKQTK